VLAQKPRVKTHTCSSLARAAEKTMSELQARVRTIIHRVRNPTAGTGALSEPVILRVTGGRCSWWPGHEGA